jgi:4-amino-4-deoxy-L-arabinose transferase-like glycosyltransferase
MFNVFDAIAYLKRTFHRKDILFLTGIIALYFSTRLINLDAFPIFSDEGIYIRWAKVAWHDAAWRFISLTDGKQPLQTWGTIPFLKFFPDNALLAGRLFSVATGFTALVGMFSFVLYLFGKKAAYLGALFYIFTPYFLFYDRLALVDSGVNSGFIWIFFFSILMARTLRLDIALLLGLIAGLALLAKSSVRMFVGLAALAPVLFFELHREKFTRKLVNFSLLYAVVAVMSLVIYNIQRLSPFFHYVAEKNKTFVLTFEELAADPFTVFSRNISLIPTYVLWEMGFFLGLCGLVGLGMLYKKDRRLFLYFLAWIVAPFIVVLFLSKVLFPRYLIFFASFLLITATYFFHSLRQKTLFTFFIVGYVLSVAYFNYAILFAPKLTPFPPIDRGQYIEGWSAGWGIKEIVDYSREKSGEKPVILVAEGNFGLAGDVLDVHLRPDDQIQIRGFWPLDKQHLLDHQPLLDKNHVFIVLSHQLQVPSEWPVRIIKKFEKPGQQSAIFLLELLPNE